MLGVMYKGGLLTCLAFRAIFISLSLDVDECAASPCENAGSCVNDKGGYHCMCALGFEGSNCDGGTYGADSIGAFRYFPSPRVMLA